MRSSSHQRWLAGCDTLYSEDLQHGQVFDEQLTAVNPFLDT
jgi:predicted nucleic acid-binding protein